MPYLSESFLKIIFSIFLSDWVNLEGWPSSSEILSSDLSSRLLKLQLYFEISLVTFLFLLVLFVCFKYISLFSFPGLLLWFLCVGFQLPLSFHWAFMQSTPWASIQVMSVVVVLVTWVSPTSAPGGSGQMPVVLDWTRQFSNSQTPRWSIAWPRHVLKGLVQDHTTRLALWGQEFMCWLC